MYPHAGYGRQCHDPAGGICAAGLLGIIEGICSAAGGFQVHGIAKTCAEGRRGQFFPPAENGRISRGDKVKITAKKDSLGCLFLPVDLHKELQNRRSKKGFYRCGHQKQRKADHQIGAERAGHRLSAFPGQGSVKGIAGKRTADSKAAG